MARKEAIICSAIATSDHFINTFKEETDSEDEEEIKKVMCAQQFRFRIKGSPIKIVRNENFCSDIVPRYSDNQFREHFRLTRPTFERLELRLGPALTRNTLEGRPRLSVRKQLLSVLWLLATPESFRSVGDRFDMSKSILHDTFVRVVEVLGNEANHFIVWPTGDKLEEVKAKFRRIGKLPNVIGAVDGSHIPIPQPSVDSVFYKTRKCEHAITLQAVCTADLILTDCFIGFPGSVPDIRVFRNSDLWAHVRNNRHQFFPDDEYIIGDKAYPVLSWCIPPFIDRGNLTQAQKNFNKALSAMRQVIERAFGLLKGRFRRLFFLAMFRLDLIPITILACCVLHNICIIGQDEDNEDFIEEGLQAIQAAQGNQVANNHELIQEVPNDPNGEIKREYLVNLIARNQRQI